MNGCVKAPNSARLNPATYDFSISTGVYAGVYTLETAIALPDDPDLQDAGGGILFHMPERDSRTGAHMVRFAGRDELIWGYYDQNGAFVGQGREQLDADGPDDHKLRIAVDKDTYRITVDGQDIVQDVPLKQQEGWIGLVSYRGPVAFDGDQRHVWYGRIIIDNRYSKMQLKQYSISHHLPAFNLRLSGLRVYKWLLYPIAAFVITPAGSISLLLSSAT